MKLGFDGCAICGSTWGALWEEVEGERLFFCCRVCAIQFRHVIAQVRAQTGWPRVESLEVTGDRRGRTCTARTGEESFRFFVAFNPLGEVLKFAEIEEELR